MEIAFNRPLGEIARWNTGQRKCTKPPPRFLMKLRQELPTSEPTIPDRGCQGMAIPKTQRTKLCQIPGLIPVVRETAEATMAQPSCRCEILNTGEMVVQENTPMPRKPLLLAGALSGILMLSGILTGTLILAGILTGILMLAGTPEPEEIDISEGTHTPISDRAQTVSRRTQIRLRKRHQRRNWIVYSKLRE